MGSLEQLLVLFVAAVLLADRGAPAALPDSQRPSAARNLAGCSGRFPQPVGDGRVMDESSTPPEITDLRRASDVQPLFDSHVLRSHDRDDPAGLGVNRRQPEVVSVELDVLARSRNLHVTFRQRPDAWRLPARTFRFGRSCAAMALEGPRDSVDDGLTRFLATRLTAKASCQARVSSTTNSCAT
jgi:hypothetical protein